MTIEELGQQVAQLGTDLGSSSDQLVKALGEIKNEIANIDNVPQSVIDALTNAQTAAAAIKVTAQALDDLNPDPPTPAPQPGS